MRASHMSTHAGQSFALYGRPSLRFTDRRCSQPHEPSFSKGKFQRRTRQLALRALIRTEVDGCWVTSPAKGAPKGIVHFLGGAFAGASPELVYPLLLQIVGEAGYTIVSTPYPVTFKHVQCAAAVHQKFLKCVETLRKDGQWWMVPEGVGIHGIGHSNGALLHLLIGSLFPVTNTSNIILSYNNKEVGEAIPIPLTGLQTALQSARGFPLGELAGSIPSTDALVQGAAAALTSAGIGLDPRAIASIVPAIEQLSLVFAEVESGAVEFDPSPAKSRALIESSYTVPYTMLVQFENDNIDETQEMTRILKTINSAGTVGIVLPGTHITPCGGDLNWQVGREFSPLDAIALGFKAFSQADIRRLGDRIVSWLESRSPALQLSG